LQQTYVGMQCAFVVETYAMYSFICVVTSIVLAVRRMTTMRCIQTASIVLLS
jgi:hypothetical protein